VKTNTVAQIPTTSAGRGFVGDITQTADPVRQCTSADDTSWLNTAYFDTVPLSLNMGVDHGGGEQVPPEFGAGGLSSQILSCCKILSNRLLALQCRKTYFLPLQQDFYSKSHHAYPHQNSSQIYAYVL